jgi:hypothetical protein
MVRHALSGLALPVYGDGQQRRDWLYVVDHCAAIRTVLERGRIGETYNVGGGGEKANIEIVRLLCDILDAEKPRADGRSYHEQISFVGDRPGHDRRYAINATKIGRDLGWGPLRDIRDGHPQDRALVSRQCQVGRAHLERLLSRLDAEELFQSINLSFVIYLVFLPLGKTASSDRDAALSTVAR